MPYYEIIYEDGSHSVANYEDDDECMKAITAHHERAKAGEKGTAQSTPRFDLSPDDLALAGAREWPAVRIKRVLVYDNHPADYATGGEVPTQDAIKIAQQSAKAREADGTVPVFSMAADLTELVQPTTVKEHPHDSFYKMKESRELDHGLS